MDEHGPRVLQRLPAPRQPARHRRGRLAAHRRVPVRLPRLALRHRRSPQLGARRGRLPAGQPVRCPQPGRDAVRHVGRVHLVQHGPRRGAAARVARPGGRSPRRLPDGGHEAHPLGDRRGRVQLEVRAGQLQRELPPALRAPADAGLDERAPQRLPVRPLRIGSRPHADARAAAPARTTRASPIARSRASAPTSSSGSWTRRRTSTTSRPARRAPAAASGNSARRRATTSRRTPTSS